VALLDHRQRRAVAEGNSKTTTMEKKNKKKTMERNGSILHFRSKAFDVALLLSIRLRFVIVTRRPEAFSSEK